MKMIKFLLNLIFIILAPSLTLAMMNPNHQWKILKSSHFELIYIAKHHDLAQFYAITLEQVYEEIQTYYSELPLKTIVIINDQTDVTNGFATRFPYPYIMIYPAMPSPNESLADFGNWTKELLAHEFAHLLSFEPANGIISPFRYIFGSIIGPNLLLPRWWKEGQSVLIETALSPMGGRLRSPYQNGTLRALVNSDKLKTFTIDKANEFLDHWPEGGSPYLLGSLFWIEAYLKKGPQIVNQLVQGHGREIPYVLQDVSESYLDMDYEKFYNESLIQAQKIMESQIELLKSTPITNSELLITDRKYSYGPRVSSSGLRLAFISVDENGSRSLEVLEKQNPLDHFTNTTSILNKKNLDEGNPEAPLLHLQVHPHDGPPSGSLQRVEWFKDSNRILFDKVTKTSPYESRSDLFVYNLKTKTTETLTQGLRAREPALSFDNKSIVFVKLGASKTSLTLLDLNTKKWNILETSSLNHRISFPNFISENEIGYSLRDDQGQESFFVYDLKLKQSKKQSLLYQEKPITQVRFVKPSPSGFLFSSSNNGVYNIYKTDSRFQKAQPLTNALAGYFNPDLDPLTQDLIVTEMTENGPQVALIKKSEFDKTPESIPLLATLNFSPATKPSISVLSPTSTQTQTTTIATTTQDYSPYEYLVPQYWLPLIGGSSTGGGWILTAQTSGHDPIGLHNYSLIGILDTSTNKGGFLFSYLNQTTDTPFLLSQTLRNTYLGTVINEVTDQTTGVFLFPSMWSWNQNLKMSVGWTYNLRSSLGYDIQRTGPGINLSYIDYTQQGHQISPNEGWGSSLNLLHFLEFPGYFSHSQFTFSLQKYLSYSWFPHQHALLARLDGTAIPQSIANYHGTASSSINTGTDSAQALFLIRGYSSGEFYGRNLVTTNLEYRFPISYPEKGWGLVPFFVKRLSGAIVVDGLTSDGRAIHKSGIEILDFSKTFWSTGIEAKLDTTVGYVAPLTFILGLYKPLSLPDGSSPLSFSFNFLLNQ